LKPFDFTRFPITALYKTTPVKAGKMGVGYQSACQINNNLQTLFLLLLLLKQFKKDSLEYSLEAELTHNTGHDWFS
tara:strand:+ start:446 stop:673 length:228 start_codon:yes stop_codon:yes gene_type:complete